MIFLKKNSWKYDMFFKCSEKMVFPKKLHWNMIFLISWGKMVFLFSENIFFSRTENERCCFSKNAWKYDVLCMLVKAVFLFPKNTPKDNISGITEKDDIHPRKDDIGILVTFMEARPFYVFSYIAFQSKNQET